MNVLTVGTGTAGSWAIRGMQLGGAIGARVTTAPAFLDWGWADAVVLVKRAGRQWADMAHRYRVPIVWDALDFWRQPQDCGATEREAMALLDAELMAIHPAVTIGATRAMAEAAGGVYLPHHSRPGLVPTPAAAAVTVVAYEGDPRYLGRWAMALELACGARGWAFVVNPADLGMADIVVAFRDAPWDGFLARHWKSGVKIVNAVAAGRPIITQVGAAWGEVPHYGSVCERMDRLGEALDTWADVDRSCVANDTAHAAGLTIATVAATYRDIIATVAKQGVAA